MGARCDYGLCVMCSVPRRALSVTVPLCVMCSVPRRGLAVTVASMCNVQCAKAGALCDYGLYVLCAVCQGGGSL